MFYYIQTFEYLRITIFIQQIFVIFWDLKYIWILICQIKIKLTKYWAELHYFNKTWMALLHYNTKTFVV